MSFNLDCKEASRAMESAADSLNGIENELKTVEKAMNRYKASINNEITNQAEEIFERMKKMIEDAKTSLGVRTDSVTEAINIYENIVKKGL